MQSLRCFLLLNYFAFGLELRGNLQSMNIEKFAQKVDEKLFQEHSDFLKALKELSDEVLNAKREVEVAFLELREDSSLAHVFVDIYKLLHEYNLSTKLSELPRIMLFSHISCEELKAIYKSTKLECDEIEASIEDFLNYSLEAENRLRQLNDSSMNLDMKELSRNVHYIVKARSHLRRIIQSLDDLSYRGKSLWFAAYERSEGIKNLMERCNKEKAIKL